MASLDELRREALDLQRKAGKKISYTRNKKNAPVDIAGTKFDPRRKNSNVNKYNRSQLEKYIATLKVFNSRSVGFSGGHEGAIITKAAIRLYKQAERAHNKRVRAENKRADKITIAGTKIENRRDVQKGPRKNRMGTSRNVAHETVHINIPGVTSEKALKALERDLRKKNSKAERNKRLIKQVGSVRKMLKQIGDAELLDEFNKLNAKHVNILLNQPTGFYEALRFRYDADGGGDEGGKNDRWQSVVASTGTDEARRLVHGSLENQMEEQKAAENARKRRR